MASPAFGKFKAPAPFTHLAAHAFHLVEVGVHALADIEPFLLRGVTGQHRPFAVQHGGDVGVEMLLNYLTQSVVQPVRQRVIDRHRTIIDGALWGSVRKFASLG